MFIGGGDSHPLLNAGRFSYATTASWLMAGTPPWNGAANEEAWQHTGANWRGVVGTFRIPPDYVSGNVSTYIWWVNNVLIAATFYVRSYIQPRGYMWAGSSVFSSDSYITSSGAVSDVFRTTAATITASGIAIHGADATYNYGAFFYNTAGAEDIGIMGVEIVYTGYV